MSVIVYTNPNCQPCKATKRKLDKEGIPYSEVNIQEDEKAKERVRALGYSSAPVVMTDDDHWSSFRPDKIAELKAKL